MMNKKVSICCNNPACNAQGRLGFSLFDKHRNPIFTVALCIALLSTVLAVAGTLGASPDKTLIKDLYWSKADVLSSKIVGANESINVINDIFIGVSGVVFDTKLDEIGTFRLKWDEVSNCSKTTYCSDCQEAATGSLTTAILACITKLPTLKLIYSRRLVESDTPCLKFMSMFATTFSILSCLSTLMTFNSYCHKKLPSTMQVYVEGIEIEMKTDWMLGPGFFCLIMSLLCSFILLIFFILTPVPVRIPSEEPPNQSM
mmetsp:Transcript_13439/g.18389  ORF Transcript_13439/g.18389 Transcript_13439/m.18389 type:complete len:258 (+) Transcript_13439:218-991(+)